MLDPTIYRTRDPRLPILGRMSSPLPVSPPGHARVARLPTDRLALVKYVRDTAGLQETDWLEWKRGYDLTGRPGRATTSKHLIGFANRPVTLAARQADGHAYLLLGVEPGNCPGVPEHDSADLETWLRPYVGDGVVYDVAYVPVDGVKVLILTLDPPKWGDEIHCLKTASEDTDTGRSMAAGTIYVRKNGKTEIADPNDLVWLTARARRQGRSLDLQVTAGPVKAIAATTLTDEFAANYLDAVRKELLAGVPAPARDPISDLAQMYSIAGETRSPETYRTEVETFIANARAKWPQYAIVKNLEKEPQALVVTLENPTDDNFEDLVLEVVLPLSRGLVHLSAYAASELLQTPREPHPWGTNLLGSIASKPVVPSRAPELVIEPVDADRTRLRFEPFRARPRTPHPLPPVLVAVPPNYAAGQLEADWRATSASTRGELKGNVRVEVLPADNEATDTGSD